MGQDILTAGDNFLPHPYCVIDPPHPVILLPIIPNVTVQDKPLGVELGFTSCGDLVLCQGAGKVFVGEPVGTQSAPGGPGGVAADPTEKVTIGGFPEISYENPGEIIGGYSRRNPTSRFSDAIYDFSGMGVPRPVKPRNAFTVIKVDSNGSTREVRNYPGPPVTRAAGANGPLPSYAGLLTDPIKVVFKMTDTIDYFEYVNRTTQNPGSLQFKYRRPNTLQINPETGEVSNFESLAENIFPRVVNGGEGIRLINDAIRIFLYAGFEFNGQQIFPNPPQEFSTITFYAKSNLPPFIPDAPSGSNAGNGRDPGNFGSTGGTGADGGRFGSTGGNGR